MHKSKAGIAFVILGAVLIGSALLLFAYNRAEDETAGRQADAALEELQSKIGEAGETENGMTLAEVEGYEYIGYLEIPAIDRTLPVLADWDELRLSFGPCRQFGSTKTDDLVIAAHNFKNHFGLLSELEPGDAVRFTDMDGEENDYEVVKTAILQPTDVEAVQNSGHDLVLYTCTYGGKTRVTVFCDRTEEQEEETNE